MVLHSLRKRSGHCSMLDMVLRSQEKQTGLGMTLSVSQYSAEEEAERSGDQSHPHLHSETETGYILPSQRERGGGHILVHILLLIEEKKSSFYSNLQWCAEKKKTCLKCSMLCTLLKNWLLLRCKSIKVKILMCSFILYPTKAVWHPPVSLGRGCGWPLLCCGCLSDGWVAFAAVADPQVTPSWPWQPVSWLVHSPR